jgi:hypothetical protein
VYLIVLVVLVHAPVTLLFCNDLTCVFDNDLVRFEAAVSAHPIAAVLGLDDFHANPILAPFASPLLEVSKRSIGTVGAARRAVPIITFVEHDSVLAGVVAAVLR